MIYSFDRLTVGYQIGSIERQLEQLGELARPLLCPMQIPGIHVGLRHRYRGGSE